MSSLRGTVDLSVVTVTAIVGEDDVDTAAAWNAVDANVLVCPAEPGSFGQRINYGYQHTKREWLLLVGDDVRFHPGWLTYVLEAASSSGCSVVGTIDLGNGAVSRGLHATHPVIRRKYVDEVGASWDGPGVVAHEGYRHCYVDNEIVLAAQQRATWVMAFSAVIEHLHPAWGKSEHDETYAIGGAAMGADSRIWDQRRAAHAEP